MSPETKHQLAPRACQICWQEFTPSRSSNIYCSKRCKNTAFHRKTRPLATTGDATNTTSTGPTQPQPAAVRDCPHCGEPITIVALLTTPEAARPTTPNPPPDGVITLRRA